MKTDYKAGDYIRLRLFLGHEKPTNSVRKLTDCKVDNTDLIWSEHDGGGTLSHRWPLNDMRLATYDEIKEYFPSYKGVTNTYPIY